MFELVPKSLKRDGEWLAVEWSNGQATKVSFRLLRRSCPCAVCNEERQKPQDPFKLLSDAEVAAGAPTPVKMAPRGMYAYQITWNDGHDTGIYTLEFIYELSQREQAAS